MDMLCGKDNIMIRIIDERGTGKTSRLMLIAKEQDATFVCANPHAMEYKAQAYGIDGINFMSYEKFSTVLDHPGNYVIDELENFIKSAFGKNLISYSISEE